MNCVSDAILLCVVPPPPPFLQVGPEVAKQVFEEHVEKLKAQEKDRKHKDDLDDEGGKKKKRSSRWV